MLERKSAGGDVVGRTRAYRFKPEKSHVCGPRDDDVYKAPCPSLPTPL